MSGTVPITIRVSPELRDRLIALAKADRRPLSSFLAIQLESVAEQLEKKSPPR
jgi:predicted transcriptional regulator